MDARTSYDASGLGDDDDEYGGGRRRRAAAKSFKAGYDDEIDFGDGSGDEEEEDDDDDDDDDDDAGRKRRKRRRRKGAAAKLAAASTVVTDDDDGPIVDEILFRRWVIPELEALAEVRARASEDRLWQEEDRMDARRLITRLTNNQEQLRRDAAELEAAAGPAGAAHGEAHARHEAYQAALAAHESQAAVLQSARAQAEQALAQLDAQHRDAMQSYMSSLAAKGYPVEHQQAYGAQYQQRMQQTRAQLLGQWQARLEQIMATVPPHPGPPQSESRGSQLLSQARGCLETCDQMQGRINAIRAAAAAHGLDLDHRTRAPAAVSAAASAGAAAGPAAAVAAVAAITDGSDFDPLAGVPEEERAEGGRIPSYAEPHWSYLVKLRGRAFIHSRWLPETEVEEDNPPYSRSSLNRWIKRCRDEAAVRGLEQWAGDIQPVWDTKTYPRAEDAAEALCSWSLEDIVDPAKYEVSKVLAAAPCDGAPAPGSPADVIERHAWSRQLIRVIDHLERFRIAGVRASGPFMMPVDPERDGAPGYFDVVKRPMDLGTIRARLECVPPPGRAAPSPPYANPEQVAADIELVWSNCRAFSPDETHDIRILCDALDAEWQRLWRRLRRRVALRGGRWMFLYDEGGVSRKFLVKWKGRSYSKCTWEHEEDIDDDEAVARYLEINRVPDSRSRPMPRQYPGGAPPTAVYTTSLDYKGRQLRSYQLEGLNWLIYAWRNSRNCILADEMGLGKTAQTVAFMHHLYHGEHDRGPYLVVVPLTTIPHWQREFAAWTDFRVCTYHDSEGGRDTREFIKTYEWFYYTRDASGQVMRFRDQFKFDVLLTTYEVSIADVEDLREVPWSLLAVDEGQRLKNKENKLMKALESLRVDRRLLLTGTPLQNNVSELWALLNFIEPEHFGSHPAFMAEFGDLRTTAQVERLTEVMRPHVLRRRKEDVEKSIPRKEETVVDVELTMMQKQYYRALFERNRAFLTRASAGSSSGAKQSAPGLLNLETELRKCCNHPFLIAGVEDRETALLGRQDERMRMLVSASGKLVLLDKLLPKLRAEGHKVLIFSQMTKMLDILQAYCKWRAFPTERIDGSIRGNARQVAIDRFSDPESNSFVFLLSTRAGGVGITLTAADTVIIFDSDWNPQNDVQAQARAHRIGQTKSVKIYRLVTRRTYEATMFERASRKLGLEQAVMAGAGWDPTALGRKRDGPSKTEIERLLREGAYGALTDDEEAAAQASRAFEESDIDALLARGSRVVTIDPSGARGAEASEESSGAAAEAARGESLHARGLLNFSKTTFAPGAQNQSVVNVDDPEFWSKVLGADARSTLLERLNKGEVTGTPQEREAFMQEVGAAGQEVIEAKLAGKAVPDWAPQLEAALVGISDPVGAFSEDQRTRAAALLDQVERPTRRRRATAAAGAGVFAAASANELEAAIGGEDEGEAYSVKGASSSSSKNRRRGKADADGGDGASKKRVHKLVERGADAGRRQAGSVGCTLNVPLCAVTLREGQDLSLCRGACLRFLSSEASLGGPSSVVGTSMRCGECESGWQRCFGCGVAGPIGVNGAPAWLDALSHPITRAISDRAKRVWLKLAGRSEDDIAAALDAAAADREKEAPTPAKGGAAAAAASGAAAKPAAGASPSTAADGAAAEDAAAAATPKPGSAAGRRIGVPDDEQRESVFQAALSSADAERPVGGAPLPWIPEGADETRGPREGEPPTPMQLATMSDADFIVASASALKSPAIARETGLPVHPWSSRPVWPCAAARCGRYYCAGCVRVIPLFGMLAGTDPHRFRCPLHACTSCTRGADAFPLLQSLVSAHGCHIRCLPGSADPAFPIRVSRRFVVPALHPRAGRAAALARGRIRVHNAGNKVAGELEDKEPLAGQAGTGKATRKGPIGTVHSMCGPNANQPPRGGRARRARKRPAKSGDGTPGKGRAKAGDTPASDGGSESADPSAKRLRPAEDDDDEDEDGEDVDDDDDDEDDDGDDVDGGDDVDDDGDDDGDDEDASRGPSRAADYSQGAAPPRPDGESWQGADNRHAAGAPAPAGPVGIIPLRR